jgi:CheY-like chemotaxis protein
MVAMMKPILLVEDDADIRKDLARLLEYEGYAVVSAADGADALAWLRGSVRPCLIILDLMMPVMDGWQLRREMLKDSELATIPVIVLTGAGDIPAPSLAAAEYISKPFKLLTLLELVGRLAAPPSRAL